MSNESQNPYQPPTPTGDRIGDGAPLASDAPLGSRRPMVAVLLGAGAYHLFVLFLLRSTPVDRAAGTLLLLNTPVIVAWGIAIWMGGRHGISLGIGACGMQGVISALMILRDIGDAEATFLFNGIIAVVWVAITAVCWKYTPSV